MSYEKKIFKNVLSQIELSRQQAIVIAEERKQELYKAVPKLEFMDLEQNSIGINLSNEILKNPNNSFNIVKSYQEKTANLLKEKMQILQSLSLPNDYLAPPYSCKKCEDTAFVNGIKCDCLKKRLILEKHKILNETSSLKLTGFDKFHLRYYPETPNTHNIVPRQAMEYVYGFAVEYAKNFSLASKNILMTGGTGLGKTHLSLSIAKEVINRGFGVIYGSAPNLLSTLENEKFDPTLRQNDTMSTLLTCDLLVFDDLGSEFLTSVTISFLYTIINTRLSRNLPTIISTNFAYKDLEDIYTPRIFSRISNNYETLYFWGNDIRRIIKDNS